MKKLITLFIVTILFSLTLTAQENKPLNATFFKKATSYELIPSIKSRIGNLELADLSPKDIKDGRSKRNRNDFTIGKGLPKGNDPLINSAKQNKGVRALDFTFDAVGFGGSASPTDPSGAVGPNHYVAVFNTGFIIYDKLGNPLTAPLAETNIFPENACCDLTISYDAVADRFVMTVLSATGAGNSSNTIQIAVSQTSDPVNGGWHLYNFPMVTDYQKLSIWSDGYYMTANKDSNSASTSEVVFAFERVKMLNGDTSAQIIGFALPGVSTRGFYSPQAFNITGGTMPAAGNMPIVFLQDDAYGGVVQDHLKVWTVDVDWVTPANSAISAAQTLSTSPFNSIFDNGAFGNLAQPNNGQSIDAIQGAIMNQAQFRKFGTHNSAVFSFVVDVDGTIAKRAGVRWFELRQVNDAAPWSIYQEGTYTSPDNKHAWMSSLAMDSSGNIGMGYSAMGGTTNQIVSSYYTGRYASDPLNTMNITETVISLGNTNITDPNNRGRYGDYSKIDVDPSDDTSFWFITEINRSNTKDVVGVFKILLPNNDTGVLSIDSPIDGASSSSETVTVTISNFGDTPQSNIPVSYTINDGTVVNEVFAGPLAAGTTAQYTFTTTADMSGTIAYRIEACTNLTSDENVNNNCTLVLLNQLITCTPTANTGDNTTETGCNLDGIKHFVLNTIDADDGNAGCNTEGSSGNKGYADRRNLITDLDVQVGTYVLQAQMNWDGGINGPEKLSVWIDFNDNGTFEVSEQLISGATFSAFGELVDFNLVLPANATLGNHTLRARCIDTTGTPGDVSDPCADYQFGETHDYTVRIIDGTVSVNDNLFNENDFIVATLANNQFNVSVNTTEVTDKLTFTVTNMIGQQLLNNEVENLNGSYQYDLDMSYATPGVYILHLGNSKLGNSKKIVVK